VLKSCKRTRRTSLRLSSVRKAGCDATHGPRVQRLADTVDTVDEFQLDCKSIRTSRGCWFVSKGAANSPNWRGRLQIHLLTGLVFFIGFPTGSEDLINLIVFAGKCLAGDAGETPVAR
jgi:hypothetical protein